MEKKVILILLMAASNMLMKVLPVRLLAGRSLPRFFMIWLKYVPVPVLAAMLSTDLFLRDGNLDFNISNLNFYVVIPTFVVAGFTRNLFLTVLMGMGTLALARYIHF